tara:strand:- start:579 stop:1016 length:438 start_codon:yes stop_codon:yes gene_type:complete
MGSKAAVDSLLGGTGYLCVVPLVDPLLTIRSRFTRGHTDWDAQIHSWRMLLHTAPHKPFYLPLDLLSRKGTWPRWDALEALAKHMQFKADPQVLARWANDWPEHRNEESRTKGIVPDLEPMAEALRGVKGLVAFLQVQGYDLGWM